ncbi:hypothetical protein [Algiphilus aromaticivorans]|jgi:hypothetical protein|uniref:hypothetical protein n=1 Tax=Algiphilus aromaticivorans TaxID=382454 RepID=UPI0005C243BD|nr:hypothetical protein [Algiphilus aromaticivorans]
MAQAAFSTVAATVSDERTRGFIRNAQQSLIEALAEGDHSRSASALAELRLALRSASVRETQGEAALSAVDALGGTLRHCYSIHETRKIAA